VVVFLAEQAFEWAQLILSVIWMLTLVRPGGRRKLSYGVDRVAPALLCLTYIVCAWREGNIRMGLTARLWHI
jgi:hypothetical protein